MNDETTHEDGTILSLLENLQGGSEEGVPAGLRGDESAETLARLYVEVLGLIPFGLPPVAPAPAVKARLLALVTDETQEVEPPVPSAPGAAATSSPEAAASTPAAPPAARPSRVVTPVRPTDSQTFERVAVAPPVGRSARSARSTSRRRWPLALAAVLALALLGGTIFQLYSLLRDADGTIDGLTAALQQETARATALAEKQAQMTAELAEMRTNFGLVTSPAVGMSPMKPVANSPQQQAKGTLYVAADHQHWYLSAHDLQPLNQGRRYQLWFIADSGAVSGGTFDAQPGAPVHLSSEHMPSDTKAVVITLESTDQGAPRPTGPEILRAGPAITL